MHRLAGLDANFLYAENERFMAHTLKIAELDCAGVYTFDRLKARLASLLPLLPPFSHRLVEVPFRLHHPVWVRDMEPDLDWHVRRHRLPFPGDASQFDALIAELASVPLDRSRPLWELHVVEGLRRGRVGVVCKLHHALADGMAAAALLRNVTTTSLDAPPPRIAPVSRPLDPTPTRVGLIKDALFDRARSFLDVPDLLLATIRGVARWSRTRREATERPPLPFATPRTSFNGRLTSERRFARTSLSMPAIKRIKDSFECSVNDVFLTLVASALRDWMLRRGESIDRPLVAAMPISTSRDDYLFGNHVSNSFVALHSHISDPIERLVAVRDTAEIVKKSHRSLGVDLMERWSELSRRWALHWWWQRWAPISHPAINLVASNVRGPNERRHIDGATIADLYSAGPLIERAGLNVTAWSYVDRMNVSILTCPRNLPDPWALAESMGHALRRLLEATGISVAHRAAEPRAQP